MLKVVHTVGGPVFFTKGSSSESSSDSDISEMSDTSSEMNKWQVQIIKLFFFFFQLTQLFRKCFVVTIVTVKMLGGILQNTDFHNPKHILISLQTLARF